jgi:hypothetical protein
MGGCSGIDGKVANDPYLPTMMKDSLYLWRPDDVQRTESLVPRSDDNFASGARASHIYLEFRYRNPGDLSQLKQMAEKIATDAGYVDSVRLLLPDVNVRCFIEVLSNGEALYVGLATPA